MLLTVITDNNLSRYGNICIHIERSKLASRYHYGKVQFTVYYGVSTSISYFHHLLNLHRDETKRIKKNVTWVGESYST